LGCGQAQKGPILGIDVIEHAVSDLNKTLIEECRVRM